MQLEIAMQSYNVNASKNLNRLHVQDYTMKIDNIVKSKTISK